MITMDDITIDAPADGETVDPMAWFESPGPFELEIGCGKGGFLLNRAQVEPDVRLLGIEWANKYYRFCVDRMARWQLTNVRVMRTDARHFLMNHLPSDCVSVLHLYHPDPWPKKRHHKRRLVKPDFVEAVVRILQPGGRWLIQSDHLEYFEEIVGLINPLGKFSVIEWEEAFPQAGPEWKGTNFEIKYTIEGRPIHRAAYRAR